ncbi:RICTOR [Cordylochernes scorpioides]|uniref:RICTOR n=1 Tax=Cordylochernes scorpioides TaxID=51811 RepID=A0ABY6KVW4_9ARAC|nr:RICTOR [Cordylochernes scorpioides]
MDNLEEIEDGLNEDCSHFSVHKIVSETLGYRKVSARRVDKWLKEAAGEWYNTGITKLVDRMKKVIEHQGDYKQDNEKNVKINGRAWLLSLQVPLFHEAVELRAGALRALRHLAQLEPGPVSTAVADRQLGLLLARSLDVALENRLERVHALRLVRVLLSVGHLPPGLVRCLVAIARDGSAEKDLMVAGCLACLCELGVVNPSLFISCGALNAVLRNVLECYQPQLSEALVGVVLSLLNQPATRVAIKSSSALEQLVAPLTDLNFRFSAETADHNFMEERESRLTASRLALVAILRSWPDGSGPTKSIPILSKGKLAGGMGCSSPEGLISFCQPGSTCLPSLIHMLHLPYPDIRKTILEIFYDLFCFPTPPWTDSHAKALQSLDPSEKQSSWQIYEGFVAAEGKSLLPPVATNRPNLVNNYFSIVLLTLGQTGLLEVGQELQPLPESLPAHYQEFQRELEAIAL